MSLKFHPLFLLLDLRWIGISVRREGNTHTQKKTSLNQSSRDRKMGQTQKIYSSEKGRETERQRDRGGGGVYIYDSASLTHRATGHYFLFRCFVGRAGPGCWLTVAFSHFLFPKQQVTFSPPPKNTRPRIAGSSRRYTTYRAERCVSMPNQVNHVSVNRNRSLPPSKKDGEKKKESNDGKNKT